MSLEKHAKIFGAPRKTPDGRQPLIGLTRDEMTQFLTAEGMKPFRAKQVWHWIYQRGAKSFAKMSNLPSTDRDILETGYMIDRPEVAREQHSEDGTDKWLLKMPDGQMVEAVFIPEEERGSLCVSSQVGCTLSCKFCHTGTQKLVRNLGAWEILAQIMHTRDALNEWPSSKKLEKRLFSNIVMMGMGEPLYNYDNVARALSIAMDGEGLAISKRKITLSTSGVVPLIYKCGEELGVNLAISLHAVNDELRSKIMPINNQYPLKDLLQACREYPAASNSRRITFEYVMLKGVNDSPTDAKELIRMLRGIPAKINLIPFNDWPDSGFECSDWKTIEKFGKIIEEGGFSSPIRRPRGRDILAACGQLKSASTRVKKKTA